MNAKFESSVDGTGMKILQELQVNARSTYSEIGKRVGLSSPAVAERIYKMEESGIINGYHADIRPNIFGHNIMAFITLTTRPDKYPKIYYFAEKQKEIIECHHVSGNESLIMKVVSVSIAHLENMVEKLSKFGETKSTIVLSSPIKKKIMKSI
jgi:Lrp/AsnC family transcriptional regulator, leucine-responsive regulatory protein